MKDILVYETPFEIENGNWGYKWIGFYNEKRFIIIFNPIEKEMMFDELSGKYIIVNKKQISLLPEVLRNFTCASPLSNKYFELTKSKYKNTSVEVVMQIIEKGYDITKIKKESYCKYFEVGVEPYVCKYVESETDKVIVKIFDDFSIIWEE